jgi:hypothetical protein
MIEVGAVASQNTNLTLGNIDALSATGRGYSRIPNEAEDVASTTMSFDDFVDMINPLEHIPVISSIYRACEGETISPVSRIAGDALYGGVMGLASAGLSAVGAIGDEIVTAESGGQSVSKTILAALSGEDSAPAIQVAQSSVGTETAKAVLAQTDAAPVETAQASSAPPATAASVGSSPVKGVPLDRSKLPYGGVMDTSMMASAQQNQALALAMAGKRQSLQTQRSMLNSRFATAAPAASTPAMTPATGADDLSLAQPETQTAMQNLLNELQAMRGISQYKNAAENKPLTGEAFDVVN